MPEQRYTRQSFLGDQTPLARCVVGIVGLGGGGSHIVQQLAYLGFQHYRLFDPDVVEESNLNRLIGAVSGDVAARTPKLEVARRLIYSLHAKADVQGSSTRWQDQSAALKECDAIFGCVDSFAERRDLEACARRYLVPYIDIGMDVQPPVAGQPHRMAGQVILSMPGHPCLTCLGFLTEERLAREAAAYGAAGSRPQVVWPNAILAASAVGILVDLLTDWTRSLRGAAYLSFDGNLANLTPHTRLPFVGRQACQHFPLHQIGDPRFKKL